jgi:hypothetical protein
LGKIDHPVSSPRTSPPQLGLLASHQGLRSPYRFDTVLGKSQGYSFRQNYCQPQFFLKLSLFVYPSLAVV